MPKNTNLIFLTIALFISFCAQAQNQLQNAAPEQTGFMRSEAKIYVVMVVVLTILAGLITYVARLDRKMSKLEKGQ